MRSLLFSLILFIFLFVLLLGSYSCANIIPPTGGPRDSLPPVMVKATPADSTVNFKDNKITLEFDEYVTVDNPQDNVVIWPNPVKPPVIESKLHTVTIKLKDSLEPNTTYTINFGRGLKDVNEGNTDSSFHYVFSTGSKLDHNVIKGKVILAETGKIDTTLIVVLQTNLTDSSIEKNPPRYYAKLDGKGNFRFYNLPTDTFNVFVLPNDYTKKYDDSTKMFAFINQPLLVKDSTTKPFTLYAYQEYKATDKKSSSGAGKTSIATSAKTIAKKKKNADTTIKVSAELNNSRQDFLKNLHLVFSDTLQSFDSSRFHFTDTNYTPLADFQLIPDTTHTRLSLAYKWKPNTPYKLVIDKDAVKDSAGFGLAKNDTLSFFTLRESDYGSILMRFQNLDTSKHPVLELIQDDKIVISVPLTSYQWNRKFILPGDYELRMLYDTNQNGVWDAGSYKDRRQPEVVQQIKLKTGTKVTLRSNWDNEVNVTL